MKNINRKFLWGILVVVVALVLLIASLVVVPAEEVGVMNGQAKPVFLKSGVHWRVPFTSVHFISLGQRVTYVTVSAASMTSTYGVVWQVFDVHQYWNATQDDTAKVSGLFTDNISDLPQNAFVKSNGIQINAVMLTAQSLSNASLQTTYQNMQGLADNIAAGILAAGNKDAEALRAQGDATLVQIEGNAAAEAAAVVAQGQAEAIMMNAPLYHQNPELFKLLVDSKSRVGN